jgi:DNA-binding transcriptional ArsR family regulator
MSRARADADVFLAIADPTRRAILDTLRDGEQTAGALFQSAAAAMDRMTQPAFSQHLAVLRRAGLVAADRRGNFRVYRLDPRPLAAVVDWASHYERFWNEKLDNLGRYLEKRARPAEGAGQPRVRRSS